MASNIINCQSCGNKIVGLKYTHNGKTYCYACYQKLQEELAAQEQQKQHLYAYIKELFGIAEIPIEVISSIDRELNSGKKLKGIELTLKYYYEIEGHQPNMVNNIMYVIRDQYEAAKQNAINNRKLQEQNAAVDLNVPPVIIKLNPNTLDPRGRKIKYNIEDL